MLSATTATRRLPLATKRLLLSRAGASSASASAGSRGSSSSSSSSSVVLNHSSLAVPIATTRKKDEEEDHRNRHRHRHRQQPARCVLSSPSQQQQRRCFHATSRREILPLIGAATLFVLVRYSYKARKRMAEEWEEYEWQLQQYERRRTMAEEMQAALHRRTVAIDLGTTYLKVASNGPPKPEAIVSREGDRAVFNGVVYADDGDGQATARGRAALERFFHDEGDEGDDPPSSNAVKSSVKLPWNARDDSELAKILKATLTPALSEALERVVVVDEDSTTTTAAPDDDTNDANASNKPSWRTVVTVPVDPEHFHRVVPVFHDSSNNILPPPLSQDDIVLLPEPVASIWGAQAQGLLPLPDDGSGGEDTAKKSAQQQQHKQQQQTMVMVLDVGGFVTQCSVVSARNDVVLGSAVVPWGGENLVRTVVRLLLDRAEMPLSDERSLSALQNHARQAVWELAHQTRQAVQVHVPYLFPDPKRHHLDVTLSRSVVEQAVQDDMVRQLQLQSGTDELPSYLSPHIGRPTDLSSLWTSVLTQALEESHQLPSNIDHVLLVGGGCKSPLVRRSWQAAFSMLGLDQTASKIVVPEGNLCVEGTVLGATTLPHAYDYSAEHGLQRRSS